MRLLLCTSLVLYWSTLDTTLVTCGDTACIGEEGAGRAHLARESRDYRRTAGRKPFKKHRKNRVSNRNKDRVSTRNRGRWRQAVHGDDPTVNTIPGSDRKSPRTSEDIRKNKFSDSDRLTSRTSDDKRRNKYSDSDRLTSRTGEDIRRKKYSGVKFPKLDLFPKLQKKSSVVKYSGIVNNTDKPDNTAEERVRTESIQPTPVLKRMEDKMTEEELVMGVHPDKAGLLTLTHSVFTRTMEQYEETLTSLSEVVAMTKLRSTTIDNTKIMFAHSEYHHPSRGVTEYIFEEIRPTRTYHPPSRTVVSAYHVLTHTSRVTNTVASTSLDTGMEMQIQDFLPRLLPPTPPLPLSTTYTTITVTKVSTITSDVTSDITITLGGRPVRTEYVVPTTMVFTDLHISREPVLV